MGFSDVYDLIGGRAAWTVLGMPTEGVVGDRRRIAQYVQPVDRVGLDSTFGDLPDGGGRPIGVVDDAGVLVGAVSSGHHQVPADTVVTRIMDPSPRTVRPDLRVDDVLAELRDEGADHAFVTTSSGILIGLIVTTQTHL
jgi:CBS domain-containing protein